MTRDHSPTGRVVIEPFDECLSVERLLDAQERSSGFVALDTSRPACHGAGFSVFGWDPADSIGITRLGPDNPWRSLRARVAPRQPPRESRLSTPFAAGWIGWVGYELGAWAAAGIEAACLRKPSFRARFALYDSLAIFDHAAQQWLLAAVEWSRDCRSRRPPVVERLRALHARLRAARQVPPLAPNELCTSVPVSNLTLANYLARVRRIQRYIEAGDVYQVNFAQRFTARTSASPLEIYRRLRRVSPSSHAALMVQPHEAVLSSSPELLFDLRGRHVVTRPIKGTRPRSRDPVVDAALRCELAESEKDRAELAMIVDVVRNDLGRACRYGSVRVAEPSTIEAHPTVFHQVATIEGQLRPECDVFDLLESAFPGGSVTGAPKIRAMQIIDELEPSPRGVYCGSIGWIGLDGDASFNIAIRTLVHHGSRVDFHVGGGIVIDSDPRMEYEETLAKAAGIRHALDVHDLVDSAMVATP